MQVDTITKQLLERLTSNVNRAIGSSIINIHNCTVQETALPFYSGFKLFVLIDSSYTPLVKYSLLDDGDITILLDGTLEAWNTANKVENPKLSVTNILEYAKCVLSTISRCNIVTTIEDIDFSQMPTTEMFQDIESAIKPPVVSFRNNSFTILTCMLQGNILYDSLINISLAGEIDITDKNFLLDQIPVDEITWE